VTDKPAKDSHALVPSVGGKLTKPGSELIHRGLLELSSLGTRQEIVPSPERARILVCDDEEALRDCIEADVELLGAGVNLKGWL